MYRMKRFILSFAVFLMIISSVCSCKPSDNIEESYTDDEIVSVQRKKVENINGGDDKMSTSDIKTGSKTDTEGKKTDNGKTGKKANNFSLAAKNSEYKYEYEFFDKRYFVNSVLTSGNSSRVKNVLKKAKSGKKVTVAFIGGSITEGTGATKDTCYSALIAKWFENSFKNADIEYVNAGIGTAGSIFGVHRVDKDVISRKPDIVFVDFAVNDKGKDQDLENATFDALIQKLYNSQSTPAVISVAMATKTGWNSERKENLICRNYDIPMLSFSKYIHTVILSGKYLWNDLFIDEVHPNKMGHKIISELVIFYLEKVLGELNKKDALSAKIISKPYTPESTRFLSAKRLNPVSIPLSLNSGFSVVKSTFQKTDGFFETGKKDAEISFTVKAKTLTLFYGKLPSYGGHFELYIDGELIKKYACATSDTWEYINSEVVATYSTAENHAVTIKNIYEEGKKILISGIGVTS